MPSLALWKAESSSTVWISFIHLARRHSWPVQNSSGKHGRNHDSSGSEINERHRGSASKNSKSYRGLHRRALPYFALPFTLIAMSTVVLVLTIIITGRSDPPTLGSSSLVMLFHGLSGWGSDEKVRSPPSELEQLAK